MTYGHAIDALTDEAFGWYFAGLTDGEGCFRISPANSRICRSWQAHFSISLRADDGPNLAAVARRMKCGRLYFKKAYARCGFTNSKPAITWNVNRIDELAGIIVPHFERHPLHFKKARDFAIWKQAVAIIAVTAKRTKKGKRFGTKLITPQEDADLLSLDGQLKASRLYDATQAEAVLLKTPVG